MSIINTYRTEFTSNMRLALQQGAQPSLAMLSTMENGSGELKLLEHIVQRRQGQKRNVRFEPANPLPTLFDRTWVAQPGEDHDEELVDSLDKVASCIDPTSAFMMQAKNTINMTRDDTWLGGFDGSGGFYGNRMSGKTGGTLVPFSGTIVPVNTGGAASGLNIAKIMAAAEALDSNFAENTEERYIGITARNRSQLFQQYQVTNADFKESYKVELTPDGRNISRIAGFSLVPFEFSDPLLRYGSLSVEAGTGYRKNPFWTKSGMCRVPWWEVKTGISPREDLSMDTWMPRWSFSENQTRTDEKRCGIILTNEAA